jgi:hypothetical protein
VGIAEINPDNCNQKEISPGMWALTLAPTFGEFSWKVVSGTAAPGEPCAGHTYNFATVFYKWTEHTNHTTTPHKGPTDIFDATWSSPAGCPKTQPCDFIDPFVFNIVVPVVRPKGETSAFVDWISSHAAGSGTYGKWMMTLQCCAPPDANNGSTDFNFNGEVIQEELNAKFDNCAGRAPGVLGPVNVTPPGQLGTWNVGELKGPGNLVMPAGENVYGYDFTGWDACTIFAYRCAGATLTLCEAGANQQDIRIKSDADKNFTDPLYHNIIGEGIQGVSPPGPEPRSGNGTVTSKRSENAPPFPYASFQGDCTSKPTILSILRARPHSCLSH